MTVDVWISLCTFVVRMVRVMYQLASSNVSTNILYVSCLHCVANVGLQSWQEVNSMKWRLEFCMVQWVVFLVVFFYSYVYF